MVTLQKGYRAFVRSLIRRYETTQKTHRSCRHLVERPPGEGRRRVSASRVLTDLCLAASDLPPPARVCMKCSWLDGFQAPRPGPEVRRTDTFIENQAA